MIRFKIDLINSFKLMQLFLKIFVYRKLFQSFNNRCEKWRYRNKTYKTRRHIVKRWYEFLIDKSKEEERRAESSFHSWEILSI